MYATCISILMWEHIRRIEIFHQTKLQKWFNCKIKNEFFTALINAYYIWNLYVIARNKFLSHFLSYTRFITFHRYKFIYWYHHTNPGQSIAGLRTLLMYYIATNVERTYIQEHPFTDKKVYIIYWSLIRSTKLLKVWVRN